MHPRQICWSPTKTAASGAAFRGATNKQTPFLPRRCSICLIKTVPLLKWCPAPKYMMLLLYCLVVDCIVWLMCRSSFNINSLLNIQFSKKFNRRNVPSVSGLGVFPMRKPFFVNVHSNYLSVVVVSPARLQMRKVSLMERKFPTQGTVWFILYIDKGFLIGKQISLNILKPVWQNGFRTLSSFLMCRHSIVSCWISWMQPAQSGDRVQSLPAHIIIMKRHHRLDQVFSVSEILVFGTKNHNITLPHH